MAKLLNAALEEENLDHVDLGDIDDSSIGDTAAFDSEVAEYDNMVADGEATADTLTRMSDLVAAGREDGGTTQAEVEMVRVAVESMMASIGADGWKLKSAAMESATDKVQLSIALEGALMDTAKSIWNKIIEAIKRIWDNFISLFDYFLSASKRVEGFAKKLKEKAKNMSSQKLVVKEGAKVKIDGLLSHKGTVIETDKLYQAFEQYARDAESESSLINYLPGLIETADVIMKPIDLNSQTDKFNKALSVFKLKVTQEYYFGDVKISCKSNYNEIAGIVNLFTVITFKTDITQEKTMGAEKDPINLVSVEKLCDGVIKHVSNFTKKLEKDKNAVKKAVDDLSRKVSYFYEHYNVESGEVVSIDGTSIKFNNYNTRTYLNNIIKAIRGHMLEVMKLRISYDIKVNMAILKACRDSMNQYVAA